ncbi:hypothetical protein ElyMa_006373300 [Elysia marginata]|uniref:G-protein coupled receptors family 1 profile domain-containing protein n=1 Tax=Elysia marginata TaxID=1093978 RepID=A0AAV4HMI5_9GAST|nr:hypothetical protein ElyMa_006373300 [Elysia marginata]
MNNLLNVKHHHPSLTSPVLETSVGKNKRETVEIALTMTKQLSGLAIACFAYDVSRIRNGTLHCAYEEIYCVISPRIIDWFFTLLDFLAWLLLVLLVLSVPVLLFLFSTRYGELDVNESKPVGKYYTFSRRWFRKQFGLDQQPVKSSYASS